jgi:hypothetical protein
MRSQLRIVEIVMKLLPLGPLPIGEKMPKQVRVKRAADE